MRPCAAHLCMPTLGRCRPPCAARLQRRSPTPSPAPPRRLVASHRPTSPFLYPPCRSLKRALPLSPRPFSLPPRPSPFLSETPHPPRLLSTSAVVAIPPGNRSRRHRFNPSRCAPASVHHRPPPSAPPQSPSHPRATGPTKAHRRPPEPDAVVKHR
jgi:hypothetical protein